MWIFLLLSLAAAGNMDMENTGSRPFIAPNDHSDSNGRHSLAFREYAGLRTESRHSERKKQCHLPIRFLQALYHARIMVHTSRVGTIRA